MTWRGAKPRTPCFVLGMIQIHMLPRKLARLETPVELEKAPVELGTSQLGSLETPVELEKAPLW